jgi:hypothetical protein
MWVEVFKMAPLFAYKFLFLTELLISEWLFLMRLKKKPNFWPRFIAGNLLCYGFVWIFPILFYNAVYASFMFLMIFVFVTAVMKSCFNESWRNIIFCSIAAYTVQHIAYGVSLLALILTGLDHGLTLGMYSATISSEGWGISPFAAVVYVDSYALVYWLMFLFFANRIKKNEDLHIRTGILLVLVFLILVVDIFINAAIIYYAQGSYDKFYVLAGHIYNLLCCGLTLSIQFGLLMQKQLKDELGVVYLMWNQGKKQLEMKRENIDLINLKCHDLKHLIREIGENADISQQACTEIEKVISIYDSSVQTGNKTLDIILTEKSLSCNTNHIELSCIADGKSLEFMDEIDIYTLFGNAVDNAIEAVMQLEEDMRVVNLTVKQKQDRVDISLYNYYQAELEFDNGLPQTTKGNKDYHGFGMKSIQRVVDKYEGYLSVTTEENVFTLDIFFPHQERRASVETNVS